MRFVPRRKMLHLGNKSNQKTVRKVLLCALIALTMTSCLYPRFSREVVVVDDFRRYIEVGFVITPLKTGYTYDPLGEIRLIFYPGYGEGFKKEEQPKVVRQAPTDALYQKPTTATEPAGAIGSIPTLIICWAKWSQKRNQWELPAFSILT